MQRILRRSVLKKYKAVMRSCKEPAKYLEGDKWTLRYLKEISAEDFWTLAKSDGINDNWDAYMGLEKCVDFKKELWFELVKCMWSKHPSVFQNHLEYICNDIVKQFRVIILFYSERVQDIHYLAKYIPPPLMKGESFNEASWKVRNIFISLHEIRVSNKVGPPSSIHDELEYNQEDCHYLTHEDWCDVLYTIEVKNNRKMAQTQIKRISTSRSSSHYDINEPIRFTCEKKASTVVLRKQKEKKTTKHHGAQKYCVLFKKVGILEQKYMLHSYGDCFGKRSYQKSIKDGLGVALYSRANDVKKYKKSEHKWKKDQKYTRKKNKRLYSIANNSGSRHDLKKIKKIRDETSKKIGNYSSDESYSDSSLSINSD